MQGPRNPARRSNNDVQARVADTQIGQIFGAAQIHKSVWRLRQVGARRVALQFPEGLLMYSCIISDILEACVPQRTAQTIPGLCPDLC